MPHRFPHTASHRLFAKQITVRSSAYQSQHQHIVFNSVNKQPVRLDVAFTMTAPVSGQLMITILFRQCFANRQQFHNLFQQFYFQSTFHGTFIVFFKLCSELDSVLSFFHFFKSANSSSRSL